MNDIQTYLEQYRELNKNNIDEQIQFDNFEFKYTKNVNRIKFSIDSDKNLTLSFIFKFSYLEEDIYFSYNVFITKELEVSSYLNWRNFYSSKHSIEHKKFSRRMSDCDCNQNLENIFFAEADLFLLLKNTHLEIEKNIDFINDNAKSIYEFYENENDKKQNYLEDKKENIKNLKDLLNSELKSKIIEKFSIKKESLDQFILNKSKTDTLSDLRKKEGFILEFSVCYSPLIYDCHNSEDVDFLTPICLTFYSTAKIELRIENGKINFYINGFKTAKKEIKYIFERQFLFENSLVKSNDTISINDIDFLFKESHYGLHHCPYTNKNIIEFISSL
tara:strand:- start:11058 stop:12053 length:996 start_codon:yes stop_codon:yes gene_type:complete